jgi:hypothetical protein
MLLGSLLVAWIGRCFRHAMILRVFDPAAAAAPYLRPNRIAPRSKKVEAAVDEERLNIRAQASKSGRWMSTASA